VEAAGGEPFDAIAVMQPTSPFTLPEDIDATIDLLHTSGADSAVSIMEVEHAMHPVKLKRLEGDRLLAYWEEERERMAFHELPRLYVRNCSVYAARRDLVEQGKIIGPDCRGYLMPRMRSLDINDELDWKFAEFLIESPKQ
jgi:CMP-N-acetylneuraminic acid synthetase